MAVASCELHVLQSIIYSIMYIRTALSCPARLYHYSCKNKTEMGARIRNLCVSTQYHAAGMRLDCDYYTNFDVEISGHVFCIYSQNVFRWIC